jgi:hypothetical protein
MCSFDAAFVRDFTFIMNLLWNERAGRALHADDRRFSELVDLGGES